MADLANYSPTRDDIVNVIQLLINNGIHVQNAKAAYEQLKAYEANPVFCVLLAYIFGCDQYPVEGIECNAPWVQIKQLAGITLKNNISSAKGQLGEPAVRKAAESTLNILINTADPRIARVAAQIVVKITAFTTFSWWVSAGLGDLASILLQDLLPAGEPKTLNALYALQYLMEDLPKEVGEASGQIIQQVSAIAVSGSLSAPIRKASFRMCAAVYESSAALDWNVFERSPLQRGLIAASPFLINTCSELLRRKGEDDVGFYTHVLRSCLFLLDYFNEDVQFDQATLQGVNECWFQQSVQFVCMEDPPSNLSELLAAAIDLIQRTLEIYEERAGECELSIFVPTISATMSYLIPALVKKAYLSAEEIEHIMESDDYQIRDPTSGFAFGFSGKSTRDIADDDNKNSADESSAAMSLRSSALRCIDALCTFSSRQAFPIIFPLLQQLWQSSEWRDREVGIALVGTIAVACSSELAPFLSGVVGQCIQFAQDTNEHVCISSMAMWSLSRLVDNLYNEPPSLLSTVVTACSQRLMSTSKRVQLSSVTALSTIVHFLTAQGDLQVLSSLMQSTLLPAIGACLPVYVTRNLACLSSLLCSLIHIIDDDSTLSQIFDLVSSEQKRRTTLFEQSYSRCFIENVPNVSVDMDVFPIDGVFVTLLLKRGDNDLSIGLLETYGNVLRDIIQREITSEVELLVNVMSVCGGFIATVRSDSLVQWLRATSASLPQALILLLVPDSNLYVKTSAMEALSQLVKIGEKNALASDTCLRLLQILSECLETDDLYEKEISVKLVVTLANTFAADATSSPQLSEALVKAIRESERVLRDDGFSDSSRAYSTMAVAFCEVLRNYASLMPSFRAGVIGKLVSDADASPEKASATASLLSAIMSSGCTITQQNIKGLITLVCTWTEWLEYYPEMFQSLQSFLYFCKQHSPTVLANELGGMPESTRGMFMVAFQLQ